MARDSIALAGTEVARRPLVENVYGWLPTTDRKRLAIRHILFTLALLPIGFMEATIMRVPLVRPVTDFVSPQHA